MDTLPALTSQRIVDDTMTLLQTHIPLQARGYRCQTADVWRVLLAATAQHHSIEAACADLATAPHPNTIRRYLADQWQSAQLPALEQQCTAALRAALPDWLRDTAHEVAIDTQTSRSMARWPTLPPRPGPVVAKPKPARTSSTAVPLLASSRVPPA